MRITSLIENTRPASRRELVAEHGLSILVELDGRTVLFDTGASGAFADNASSLGLDLRDVELVVLSHHHYDHGGGLERFFRANQTARLFLGSGPWARRYFRVMAGLKRPIGLSPSLLERFADRIERVDGCLEVVPGLVLLTTIGSAHPRPAGNRRLLVDTGATLEPDSFEHELLMVVEEPDGIVIFTGCSHRGVLNMIEAAVERFPGQRIKAIVGGLHLIGNPLLGTMAHPRSEIEALGRSILSYSPGLVLTGHCTGSKAFKVLQGVMGDRIVHLSTGTVLEV